MSLVNKMLLVAVGALIGFSGYGQQPKKEMPNILFIMVDDLRPELACYGKEHIISPNIDRIAKMGQIFTNAYVSYPSCGPSRASLLSGLYASRSRYVGWNCMQDEDVPGVVSLPMHFRNNGYNTVSLGKVYNSLEDGYGSWNEVWKPPVATTEWGDYQTNKGIEIFEEINKERHLNTRPRDNKYIPKRGLAYERAEVNDDEYLDGKVAARAIEKIQEFRISSQPFFMAVGFHKPHLPYNAPEKYWRLYDSMDIKLPENMYQPENAPDISMKPGNHRSHYGIPNEGDVPDSLIKELIRGYYACISYVDHQIGRIINSLEWYGLEENTIIILWGDHGYHLGENNLWAKHVNYRKAARMPLIIKVPGKEGDIQQDGLTESVDIYPTLCDVVGLSKPFHLQGQSFINRLDNPKSKGKEAIYFRTGRAGKGETIITEDFSYSEFFNENNEQIANMLYDLNKDPGENHNVADVEKNKEIVSFLSRKLNQHMDERDQIIFPTKSDNSRK